MRMATWQRASALLPVTLMVWLLMIACGCATNPARAAGCQESVSGVPGQIHPETSGLTCAGIRELIEIRPSTPEGFLTIGEHPHRLWKCRLYRAEGNAVLMRCRHHRERFSLVRTD